MRSTVRASVWQINQAASGAVGCIVDPDGAKGVSVRYLIRHHAAMAEIDPSAWDALEGVSPFTRHAALARLEATGCVGDAATGWRPCPLTVYAGDDLVAGVVLYVKTDSYGEYIFDWAWADASHRAGIAYYPKLVGAIPFTPAGDQRVLRAPGVSLDAVGDTVVRGLQEARQRHGASGVHLLFCTSDEADFFARHGYIARHSHQYHWERAPHWQTFADYLADMRAPHRKQIKKERARAQAHGFTLSMRPMRALGAIDRAALYAFYRQTVWEKGANAYLTAGYFEALAAWPDDTVYVAMAHAGERPMAAALFFRRNERLYGRYWGACDSFDALHFELCYYLPIAWGLQHGIRYFEAGAQGEHKLKRGFLPTVCHSVHTLTHPGLHQAVAQFCAQESEQVHATVRDLTQRSPFHRPDKTDS